MDAFDLKARAAWWARDTRMHGCDQGLLEAAMEEAFMAGAENEASLSRATIGNELVRRRYLLELTLYWLEWYRGKAHVEWQATAASCLATQLELERINTVIGYTLNG